MHATAPLAHAHATCGTPAVATPRPCEIQCEVVAVRHLGAAAVAALEAEERGLGERGLGEAAGGDGAASDAGGGAAAEGGAGGGEAEVHGCAVWLRLSGPPTQATLRASHEPTARMLDAAGAANQEAAGRRSVSFGALPNAASFVTERSRHWAEPRGGSGGATGAAAGAAGAAGAACGAALGAVLPAEMAIRLTGRPVALHASSASSSAVSKARVRVRVALP